MTNRKLTNWLTLALLVGAAHGFGAWVDSWGAGCWMFVVLLIAENTADNYSKSRRPGPEGEA